MFRTLKRKIAVLAVVPLALAGCGGGHAKPAIHAHVATLASVSCPDGPLYRPCGAHAKGWATQGPEGIAAPRAIVTPTHEMFDTITVGTVPSAPWAVAGYTSGFWPTFLPLVRAFPSAHHLSIAINALHDADCADDEPLDLTNSQTVGWIKRQLFTLHSKLVCAYTSISNMGALKSIVAASGVVLSRIKWWCAWYRFHPGLVDGCDAVQWTDTALGRNLDESTVRDDFFGPTGPSPEQLKRWHDLGQAKNVAFRTYKHNHCRQPQGKSPYCAIEAGVIKRAQAELFSTGGTKRFACFGPAARGHTKTIICWIVRPEASYDSQARDASKRALVRCLHAGPVTFPTPCKQRGKFAQRIRYFDAAATALVKAYS